MLEETLRLVREGSMESDGSWSGSGAGPEAGARAAATGAAEQAAWPGEDGDEGDAREPKRSLPREVDQDGDISMGDDDPAVTDPPALEGDGAKNKGVEKVAQAVKDTRHETPSRKTPDPAEQDSMIGEITKGEELPDDEVVAPEEASAAPQTEASESRKLDKGKGKEIVTDFTVSGADARCAPEELLPLGV